MPSTYKKIHAALKDLAIPEKAAFFPRFFKTGKGQYGEGDQFLGVTVPNQRLVSKEFYQLADDDTISELLHSPWHEDRLTGLLILNLKYKKDKSQHWVDLYLSNIDCVNNWDLVDSSATTILGDWLEDKDRTILYEFANENHLWKNRIALISCFHFIKKNDLKDFFRITAILLKHPHDLIHKAIGWMLREAWKRDPDAVEKFMEKNLKQLPRTALRYAIEKMPPNERAAWMQG
jgi:3-methyladenine DNA glycosylase AlkD